MIKRRGLRDIATGQRAQRRGLPQSRQQAISDLARLEQEKTRLQRELEIWQANQQRTEQRLALVDARLAQLQPVLGLHAAPPAQPAPPERLDAAGWGTFALEY
ncbi:MAG: hypothetical protein H7Z42_14350 [Roseiflexaceae bacterium]|nr:hypothetical protein [Roseiflexaceae bacterium]